MRTFVLFGLLLFLAHFAFSANGAIEGHVFDMHSLKPLAKVEIKIIELNITTTTNDSGRFEFKSIIPGKYRIIFTALDYQQKLLNVTVFKNKTTPLKIFLEKKPSGHLDQFMYPKKRRESYVHPSHSAKNKHLKIDDEMEFFSKKSKHSMRHSAHHNASGLKAGYADDNKQFNYFVKFLQKYGAHVPHYPLAIKERIWLNVVDAGNRPVLNAQVKVFENGQLKDMGRTYADGSFFIFPLAIGIRGNKLRVTIDYHGSHKVLNLDRNGLRKVRVKLDQPRETFQQIPLDLLFILDTAGSMGEEIERLKNTIQIINDNLATLEPKPNIRFGMVLYRDKDDDYDTKIIPFSKDLKAFRQELSKIKAEGGGDTPEDLQSALKAAVTQIGWRPNAIRLGFVITDASAHLDYNQSFNYVSAAKEAKQKGIKIFTVGTGGLDIKGEYLLRQIAQYTYGKYIFLTYGEKGESEGGHVGSVSHHTGTNFQTDKLEAVIIRFAKQELSYQSNQPISEGESYFTAIKVKNENKEATLQKLFFQALGELKDYSTLSIPKHTKLSVMPVATNDKNLADQAEYFTEQLTLAVSKDSTFDMVERKDLQYIAKELGLELGGFTKPENAAKVGKLLGADLLIVANLFKKGEQYEIFLKLERVSTAEILAVTRVKFDASLGL